VRVTINNINKALAQEGIKAEIVKGDGYFYFVGDDMDTVKEQGVYGVRNLSSLTIEQWVQEARDKMENL
jgi:hypothetical protein